MPDWSKKIASKIVPAGDISNNSEFVFEFEEKAVLYADKSYAFIVGCYDPDATIQIATLGEKTLNSGKWMTSQPYNVGVMLKSANAETWTPIQNSDIRFEIYSTEFVNEQTFSYEPVDVVDATDLMFSLLDENFVGTNTSYSMTLLDASPVITMEVDPLTPYEIGYKYTGKVGLNATLKSNGLFSPTVSTDAQIMVGKVDQTSSYTSVGFEFDPDAYKIVVMVDRLSDGTSSSDVQIQILNSGSWNWVPMTLTSSDFIEDGWYEDTYELIIADHVPDVTQEISRVRINLDSNDVDDRIIIQSLRLNTLNL
jgi:hypothetical protein